MVSLAGGGEGGDDEEEGRKEEEEKEESREGKERPRARKRGETIFARERCFRCCEAKSHSN